MNDKEKVQYAIEILRLMKELEEKAKPIELEAFDEAIAKLEEESDEQPKSNKDGQE